MSGKQADDTIEDVDRSFGVPRSKRIFEYGIPRWWDCSEFEIDFPGLPVNMMQIREHYGHLMLCTILVGDTPITVKFRWIVSPDMRIPRSAFFVQIVEVNRSVAYLFQMGSSHGLVSV